MGVELPVGVVELKSEQIFALVVEQIYEQTKYFAEYIIVILRLYICIGRMEFRKNSVLNICFYCSAKV